MCPNFTGDPVNVTTLKGSHVVRPVLLIVTSYLLLDRRKIGGGIGEHYVGLYGTLVKKYSKTYRIFWYSVKERSLYMFDVNGNVMNSARMPMPVAIFKVLAKARGSSRSIPCLTTVIAYYYAAKNKPLSFLVSLFLLHLLRILSLTNVTVDIIDPPVEVHVTYNESPSYKKILWGTLLDILTLKKGTLMWFCSNSYQKYLTTKYRISLQRTHVIYDGSFPNLITPKPPKSEGSLTIFYSGALVSLKGVPQLIRSVDKLRKKGINVNLLLTGGVSSTSPLRIEIKEKAWIKSMLINDWIKWTKILSEKADICVIPYPRRLHWDITFHMKLPDYMAAGKPIVSMYGTETAYILNKYKCGLIARNWDEFEEHILRLYEDRRLAKNLGENGRKAVEEFFNYPNLANMLHELIQKHLRVSTTGERAQIGDISYSDERTEKG